MGKPTTAAVFLVKINILRLFIGEIAVFRCGLVEYFTYKHFKSNNSDLVI